jgi:hypothetical protein
MEACVADRNCPYCALDKAAAVIGPCAHRASGVVVKMSDGHMAAVDPNDGKGLWPKAVGPFATEEEAKAHADALAEAMTSAIWEAAWKVFRERGLVKGGPRG